MGWISNYTEIRKQAINTNYYLIQIKLLERGLHQHNYHNFLLGAAKWSFKQWGYGKADLDGYLGYLDSNPSKKRLWATNVKCWHALLKTIFERDKYTCTYCDNVGGKLEGDHIVPISKGGTDDPTNLTTSCRRCNRQKRNKSVHEFSNWKATLSNLEKVGIIHASTT